MKRLMFAVFLITSLVIAVNAYAAVIINRTFTFSSATAGATISQAGLAIGYHKLLWNVSGAGTLSSCSIRVEKSNDAAVWTDLISAQSCTSSGQTIITAAASSYVRVRVTAFIRSAGTPTIIANYLGMNDIIVDTASGTGADTQVTFFDGAMTVTGDAGFTYNDNTGNLNVRSIGNIRNVVAFTGANAGAKFAACKADLPSTGGICDGRGLEGAQTVGVDLTVGTKPVNYLLGYGTYTFTVSQTPSDYSSIIGQGAGATTITWATAGYWIDLPPAITGADTVNDFHIKDVLINVSGAGTGCIRVGTVDQDLDISTLIHNAIRWKISNVYCSGPGTGTAGKIDMIIVAMIDSKIEDYNALNFHTMAKLSAIGNNKWERVRWQVYCFGPLISGKLGTGIALVPSPSQDVFEVVEFLGPTCTGVAGTNYGYTVTVAQAYITFINALYEAPGGSQAMIRLGETSYAGGEGSSDGFLDINGVFSEADTHDLSIKVEQQLRQKFKGTICGSPCSPIDFGTNFASGISGTRLTLESVSQSILIEAFTTDPIYEFWTPTTQYSNTVTLLGGPIVEAVGMIRAKAPVNANCSTTNTLGKSVDLCYNGATGIGNVNAIDYGTGLLTPLELGGLPVRLNTLGPLAYATYNLFAVGDTTPDVSTRNLWATQNSGATSITTFDGLFDGQCIYVVFQDVNTTLVHGTLLMKGGINKTYAANDVSMFCRTVGQIREMFRLN